MVRTVYLVYTIKVLFANIKFWYSASTLTKHVIKVIYHNQLYDCI